jgi:hypothetical protein
MRLPAGGQAEPAVLPSLLNSCDCRPKARRSLLYFYPYWIAATAGRRPGGACCTLILTELMRLPSEGQAEPAVLLSLLNLCDCRPEARRSLLYSYPYWIAATAGRRPGGACCTLILTELMRLPAGGQAEPAVPTTLLNLCDCRPEARRSLLYSYP